MLGCFVAYSGHRSFHFMYWHCNKQKATPTCNVVMEGAEVGGRGAAGASRPVWLERRDGGFKAAPAGTGPGAALLSSDELGLLPVPCAGSCADVEDGGNTGPLWLRWQVESKASTGEGTSRTGAASAARSGELASLSVPSTLPTPPRTSTTFPFLRAS
jgi:hypothetical protein